MYGGELRLGWIPLGVHPNAGEGLNPTTGIFTCPVGGTYMFIIHLSTHKDKVTTTILMPWSDLNFVESPAFTEEEWCGHGEHC